MISKTIQKLLLYAAKEFVGEKMNVKSKVRSILKTYWKYFLALVIFLLVIVILIFWAVWTLISQLFSSGSNLVPQGIIPEMQQIEEVGINGLIAQPIKFIQDFWYGKDGQ